MAVVADIASTELRKDVIAIRTEEDAATARSGVERLLRRTLTVDAAVQIALLNNRGLQAAYNQLALAEADLVGESLPPNPKFSYSRLSGPLELEIERRIVGDILALVTLPARSEIALVRFRQAQLRAALETLRVAADARRAFYRAVASREVAGFLEQAQSAAEAATEFAVRLGETGAMNKLDQAREQVFYADLTAELAAARQRANSDREVLIRWLGLWGHDLKFKLPSALPVLPRRVETRSAIEVEAIRRRVDLQIARMELELLTKIYGLTQATRFINLLDASYGTKSTRDNETGLWVRDRGPEVEFAIPLFDFGEVRVRQAESIYKHAVNRLVQMAINVRSEARDAYRDYRSIYDIAGHYQNEVLPLRKIISEETLLRYNAMQIDVFSLLAEARQRIAATLRAIETKRDFWLAKTELQTAVVGGLVAGAEAQGARRDVAAETGAPAH